MSQIEEEWREKTRAVLAETHENVVLTMGTLRNAIDDLQLGKAEPSSVVMRLEKSLTELLLSLGRRADEMEHLGAPPILDEFEDMTPAPEKMGIAATTGYGVRYSESPFRVLRLDLPELPPRLPHKWRGGESYQTVRDRCHRLVHQAIRLAKDFGVQLPEMPFESAVVLVISHFGDSRLRDTDNYATKFLADALVEEGLLPVDSYKVVPYFVSGIEPDAPARTEIVLAEAVPTVRRLLGSITGLPLWRFLWNQEQGGWTVFDPEGERQERKSQILGRKLEKTVPGIA